MVSAKAARHACPAGAVLRESVMMGTKMCALPFALLMAVAVAGCAVLRVGSDYDRQASFTSYHSFTWLPRAHRIRNPLTVQRARDAIQAELVRKGYALASDAGSADFAVDFTIGSRARMDVHAYPTPYFGSWYWGGSGWWGYPYWGSQVDVRQYREGTLSIDVFDARSHRPVWHGWAKKELSASDIERSEKPIREAVDAVLAKFPPT
jgi:hypothetical protein